MPILLSILGMQWYEIILSSILYIEQNLYNERSATYNWNKIVWYVVACLL